MITTKKRGNGKTSYIKLYEYLMTGKRVKTTQDISLYMGVPKIKVAFLVHNARKHGGLAIWTIYNGGGWGYAVKKITPVEAQYYTNRVAKYGLGVFQNSASTLMQSSQIGGSQIREMIAQTGAKIIQILEPRKDFVLENK